MADSPVQGDLRGAIVMAGFSLVWFLWPALVAPFGLVHRLSWVLGALSLATVLFARRTLAAFRARQPEAGRGNPFRYPAYRWSVVFEVVGVIVAAALLEGHPATARYFPTVLALIVGLHFLGLLVAFRSSVYAIVCAAMCVCGLSALAAHSVAARTTIVALGCGLILLTTAVVRTLLVRNQLRRQPRPYLGA